MKSLFKKKKDKAPSSGVAGRGPVAPGPVVTDHEGASSDVRCAAAAGARCIIAAACGDQAMILWA
jgi:hypothetical protein